MAKKNEDTEQIGMQDLTSTPPDTPTSSTKNVNQSRLAADLLLAIKEGVGMAGIDKMEISLSREVFVERPLNQFNVADDIKRKLLLTNKMTIIVSQPTYVVSVHAIDPMSLKKTISKMLLRDVYVDDVRVELGFPGMKNIPFLPCNTVSYESPTVARMEFTCKAPLVFMHNT